MPLSEFRAVLEERLTAWNLPAELAVEIEERLTPVTFEKGAIVFLRGAPGTSSSGAGPPSGRGDHRRGPPAPGDLRPIDSARFWCFDE